MSRSNDVTLFSNGIGHFRRVYKVSAGTTESISIPFKRNNIGDVAASLQVFGNVRLNTPPSFTPSNANATALKIDQQMAFKSLLRNLSGASVTIKHGTNPKYQGILLGIDYDSVFTNGSEVLRVDYVIVSSSGTTKRMKLSEVEEIYFDDESVRTEIDKALKNNFQLIKPDSTLLDLSLTAIGDQDVEAIVQYTIPVASWKMRYAIREIKSGNTTKFTLEGSAIIDNNTDEDWDNFKVSVVTGNPISFQTDIATVCVPNRKLVRLVDDTVLDNFSVEDGYQVEAAAAPLRSTSKSIRGLEANARSLNKMSVSNTCQYGMGNQSLIGEEMEYESNERYSQVVAEAPGVDSKDVGDFCVFTSKEPITILARKSAVVPMFVVDLKTSGIVLLYKEANHTTRPYRAVKFKNESTYSLGKGKTVIYNDGIFSGECVLESTKPGENRMLPHCLENGVKITRECRPVQNRRTSIRVSEGVALAEEVSTAISTYTIVNKKDQPFKLAIEHSNVLSFSSTVVDFTGVEIKEKEKLPVGNGYRVYMELAPNQTVTLMASETQINRQEYVISNNWNWIRNNIIDTHNPLSENKDLMACIKIQEQIDAISREIDEYDTHREELNEQVNRVRANLTAAKDIGNSQINNWVNNWVKDIDDTEKEIRNIDKEKIPSLKTKMRDLQLNLTKELKRLALDWKDTAKK